MLYLENILTAIRHVLSPILHNSTTVASRIPPLQRPPNPVNHPISADERQSQQKKSSNSFPTKICFSRAYISRITTPPHRFYPPQTGLSPPYGGFTRMCVCVLIWNIRLGRPRAPPPPTLRKLFPPQRWQWRRWNRCFCSWFLPLTVNPKLSPEFNGLQDESDGIGRVGRIPEGDWGGGGGGRMTQRILHSRLPVSLRNFFVLSW